jgi:hypothetical protein
MKPFVALWDTGATHSMITQAVVDACGLVSTGLTRVNHAQGTSQVETFVVNIRLPNDVTFPTIRVTKGVLRGGPEVLIGMDIIGAGDFAITNPNGNTKLSYRYPSLANIDFAEEDARGSAS